MHGGGVKLRTRIALPGCGAFDSHWPAYGTADLPQPALTHSPLPAHVHPLHRHPLRSLILPGLARRAGVLNRAICGLKAL